MKTAISYLRYSSRIQSRTDSHRRQIEATEKFCKDHDLALVNRLEDLGVSAWTGKNLSDESALGGFLKVVEAGKIARGTVLIVENLDRLSRAKILDALHLFTSIIKKGITIVTTMDGKWYSEDSISATPTDLMISIIYLTRGNNESETKSVRIKTSWVNKHAKIQKGEFSKFNCPSWLTHNGHKYSLIESHAETIRLIFELYNKGCGVYSLIQELHKRKIKSFTKSKDWKPVFVHRLLQNPAVIGTCENVDPPKANYYPPVVSEAVFYKAVNQRKQNVNFRGKTGAKMVNIFGGLVKCAACGSNLVKYSCKSKGENAKKYTFFICSQSKVGKCRYAFTPFEKFSDSFLQVLKLASFTQIILEPAPETPDNREIIRGKIVEVQKTIDRVTDAIVKTDSEALVIRLSRLEQERKQLEQDYENAQAQSYGKPDTNKDYNEIVKRLDKELKNGLTDNDFRLKLRNLMRQHIEKIEVEIDDYFVKLKNPAHELIYNLHVGLMKDTFYFSMNDDDRETYRYSEGIK